MLAGWHGTLFALEGAALALILLLPLVLLRALGAGDWKLMGGRCISRPDLFLFVLLGSVFASGIMAVVQVLRVGRVMERFETWASLVKGFFAFG